MDALRTDDPGWLGPFTLFARLGAGGMGQVYLGRAPEGRLVAVKAVHASYSGDHTFRARFEQEIRTAVQVRAPWTVAVLDADPNAPRPWLAGEYIAGPSLEHTVTETGALPEDAVGVLAGRLAEALAGLHATGVVHRDLKPSNVLLDHHGPRLVDFGVARAAEATQLTSTGVVVGTPAFMSPEQAAGGDGGPPSDVFSFASVVVFAATGAGPYGEASSPMAMLYRVTKTEPDISAAPEWLRELLTPCLAKDPAARPTAAELVTRLAERAAAPDAWPTQPVADLARAQAAELVRAEWARKDYLEQSRTTAVGHLPAGPTQVVTQVVRPGVGPHRPGGRPGGGPSTGLVVGIALAAVLLLVGSLFAIGAVWSHLTGNPAVAAPGPIAAAAGPPGAGPTGAVPARAGRTAGSVPFAGQSINAIAVSPDSRRAYVAGRDGVSVIDRSTGAVSVRIQIAGSPNAVAVSPDGGRLYVGSMSGFVSVIDTTSYQPMATYPVNLHITGLVLGPGGRSAYLTSLSNSVFGGGSDSLSVLDTATGSITGTVALGKNPRHLAAVPDGSRILVAGDEDLRIVDTATNSVVGTVAITSPRALAVSPDGTRGYVATSGAIAVIDIRAARKLGEIRSRATAYGLAVSPTGRYLYVAVSDFSNKGYLVQVVDTTTAFTVEKIVLDRQPWSLTGAPDGQRLYLAGTFGEPLTIVDPAGRR